MPMTELVENPWLNISWENSIAEIDKEYLTKFSCFKKIQTNTLPEPYTGDVRSNVYCLNLNPGSACVCDDSEPQIKEKFEKYTQLTLRHDIDENMWFLLKETAGYTWLQQMTKELREYKKGQNPRMFVIEYFPYHTVKGTYFPRKLPSYEYSNQLIRQAMAENKYIVIMRHRKEWLQRISGLEKYERLVYLNNRLKPYLTKKNIEPSEKNIERGFPANIKFDELLDQF